MSPAHAMGTHLNLFYPGLRHQAERGKAVKFSWNPADAKPCRTLEYAIEAFP
jgi:hypothetical protein